MLSLRELEEAAAEALSSPSVSDADAKVTLRRFVEYAFVTDAGTHERCRRGVTHVASEGLGSISK
jgi:hypothetical protein